MNTSAFDMFRVLTLRRGSIWARYGVFIVLSLAFTTLLVVTVGNNSDNEDFFSIFAGSNRPTTRSRSHGEDGDENNEIGMPKIPVAEVQNEVTKFSRVSASRKVNAHDTGNTVLVTEDNAEDRSRTLRSIESNSVRGSRNNNIVTQGGQDPDPDANTKREFIKQVGHFRPDDYYGNYWFKRVIQIFFSGFLADDERCLEQLQGICLGSK